MENYENYFDKTCRICLHQGSSTSMVSLVSKSGVFYKKVLLQITNISIDFEDKLPVQICTQCKKTIDDINTFVLMCQNNDKRMRELLNFNEKNRVNYKQTICQYAMFGQYFPEVTIKKTLTNDSPSFECKKQTDYSKIKSPPIEFKSEIDDTTSNDYENHDDGMESDGSTEINIDSVLDSMEQAVKDTPPNPKKKHNPINNPKSYNSILDSIAEVINARIKHINLKKKVTVQKDQYEKPEKNLTCNICNKTLKTQYNYNCHMQRHTKYLFMCDQCGRGYPARDSLTRHLIFTHGTGPYISCDHCSFKCHKKLELVEHMRLHTGERPFTCDKCGLTFRRRAIWKDHLIYHEEKSVQCTACNQKFHKYSAMRVHFNSMHERVYMYACSICNVSYARTKSVRQHLLVKHNIPREKQGKILRVSKDSNIN